MCKRCCKITLYIFAAIFILIFAGLLELGVRVIARPPRSDYFGGESGPAGTLSIPVSFTNRHKQKLVGTLFTSKAIQESTRHVCVIYLHGNAGSQSEGHPLAFYFLPHNVSVFCFDFSGCGHSEGSFITLGHREHGDVIDAINFLASEYSMDGFVLWGRSMGAACALMAAPLHSGIRAIIVDSAYTSVSDLMNAVVNSIGIPTSSKVIRFCIRAVKIAVRLRAGMNVDAVNPLLSARNSTIPLILGHSPVDRLVPFSHGMKIWKEYGGSEKEMVELSGGHNSERGRKWRDKCMSFALKHLGIDEEAVTIENTAERPEHAGSFADLLTGHIENAAR